jgi:hypothetical protein
VIVPTVAANSKKGKGKGSSSFGGNHYIEGCTSGYNRRLLAKTANRLAVIFILPTATANRLGGGGYFYNRRLAVITGGLKPLLKTGFGPGLDRFWAGLKSVLGYFYTNFGPDLHLFWAIFCTED